MAYRSNVCLYSNIWETSSLLFHTAQNTGTRKNYKYVMELRVSRVLRGDCKRAAKTLLYRPIVFISVKMVRLSSCHLTTGLLRCLLASTCVPEQASTQRTDWTTHGDAHLNVSQH